MRPVCTYAERTPLPRRYIGIKTLGGILRQSLECNGLRGKVFKNNDLVVKER